MKNLTYRFQFIALAIWIFIILILFKVIPDRKIASTGAGLGFVIIPSLFLLSEFQKTVRTRLLIIAYAQFLILFALPIFLMRVLNWDTEFNQLSFLGISSGIFHKYSNSSYLLILLVLAFCIYRNYLNKKLSKNLRK